ncbi:GPI-anchored hemophore Pga7p [[Candida] jaroonii]|uniref:GPI-anchored hemophore Pga7p n=1 Tax=[Candida] jaroonii TaxID=467808 RepID=A0ACA9YBI3_9ASCO|nr:GPI-anchored hemophore Pga7p [[Candida] jaroonii]
MFFVLLLLVVSVVKANNWDTYPQVPKTASINGFADPIYDDLPECAKDCVKVSTGNTPCPYWDTGCLCVMPQWSGMVAQCIAEGCKGNDVQSATSLAYSLCSSVGADIWLMPASVTAALTKAAGNNYVQSVDPSNTWNTLKESSSITDGVVESTAITSSAAESNSSEDEESESESSGSSSSATSSSSQAETSSGDSKGLQVTFSVVTVVLGSLFGLFI